MSRRAGAPITRRRALGMGVLACGVACMGVGLSSVMREAACTRSYGDLAQATRLDFAAGATPAPARSASTAHADTAQQGERDWDALREVNQNVAAWVSVQGTDIDLPIVATHSEDDQDWYLTHDLWGRSSCSGTPFLDRRCEGAGARHVCAYAHHMTSTSGMFSQLQEAYLQKRFDRLGSLRWETPEGIVQAEPLCALRVDASWQEIQRFDWGSAGQDRRDQDDVADFHTWLEGIAAQADALSPQASQMLANAARCITLVTCSSDFAMQRWRTLALWTC